MSYTIKVSPKGWIVIPAELRRRYGIEPGGEVKLVPEDRGIEILPTMTDAVRETAGKYRVAKPTLAQTLREERVRDRSHEDRRLHGRR